MDDSVSDPEPEQLVSLHGDEAENVAPPAAIDETAPASPNPDEILAKIRTRLPPHLKQSHTDALIIHAERDEVHAAALKRAIDGVVRGASSGDDVRGSATLVDDAAAYVTSHVDWLQQALAQHTYVFVIFTAHLLADARLKNMADASFWETVAGNSDKRSCFVPAYITAAGPEQLQLSPYFRHLTGIYTDKAGSWQSRRLEKTIRVRIGDKKKRAAAQKEEQKRHVRDTCPDLYQLWMAADFPDLLSGD